MDPEAQKNDDAVDKGAVDKWAQKQLKSTGKTWTEMNNQEKFVTVATNVIKVLLVILLLYMFIISLSLMGGAFKVMGGKSSGKAFRQSDLFSNPIAGICLGILATVLVQSSSTSTSVIITMTAAGLVTMRNSIPMIMGANIGTAVTASIVSLASVADRDSYRRAFAGAVVHYCFNILTVVILLPLEVITHMIEAISYGIVDAAGITDDTEKGSKQDFLKKITKPISSKLLQVDKKLITKIAEETDPVKMEKLEKASMIVQSQSKDTHMFMDTPMSDSAAGVLLMIVSLLFLSVCLVLLVKTLQSVFKGRAAIWIGKAVNLEIKSVPLIGDYILMVFGMGLTILMQSSSVTTSTLTPLVGEGIIRVDKMFPFTIGANIGTTVTGVLAALAASNMRIGLQVALSHLLFNLFGTLMWFMVPITRKVPLGMAMFLGDLASEVKLFPPLLIVFAWVVLPGGLLLLSMPGVALVAIVGGLILLACAAVIVLLALRAVVPNRLPEKWKADPKWLPPCMCVDSDERERRRQEWGLAADEAATTEETANVDAKKGAWWQAPMAWGSGWFILMALVISVPNCQWGNLKYTKWDGRDHVGIGAWAACSAMFEQDVPYAPAPSCSTAELTMCANFTGCNSDTPGANKLYEKAWLDCRDKCSAEAWRKHCKDQQSVCQGTVSSHLDQCDNVTDALQENLYDVSYKWSATPAWTAGDRCRDLSHLCKGVDSLQAAGVFGWLGFAFATIGQALVMAYLSLKDPIRKMQILVGSLASFVAAWITLLISWSIFAGSLSNEVECRLMDVSARGAVIATGKFGNIIKGDGSFGYGCIVGSWCLMTLVVLVVGHRAYVIYKDPEGTSKEAVEASM